MSKNASYCIPKQVQIMRRIMFGLCGSYSEEYDPYKATSNPTTQKILLAINSSPKSTPQIATQTSLTEQEVLKHLDILKRCQLLRETTIGNRLAYQPSFTIFTLQDQRILQPLIEKLSKSLTRIVKNFRPTLKRELEKMEYAKAGHRFPDLEYIVIGAYAFDFTGLQVLKEACLITVSKEMPGGNYVFFGLEAGLVNLRKAWMWGHTCKYGVYTFATHGRLPRKSTRRAFPDIAALWTHFAENDAERKEIERQMIELGDLLCQMLEKPQTLEDLSKNLHRKKTELIKDLILLEGIDYVAPVIEKGELLYRLNRPIFLQEDCKRIQRISREIASEFVKTSLKRNYQKLEQVYRKTSPTKMTCQCRKPSTKSTITYSKKH